MNIKSFGQFLAVNCAVNIFGRRLMPELHQVTTIYLMTMIYYLLFGQLKSHPAGPRDPCPAVGRSLPAVRHWSSDGR